MYCSEGTVEGRVESEWREWWNQSGEKDEIRVEGRVESEWRVRWNQSAG